MPTLNELEEKIFAVHVSNYLPAGKLEPGYLKDNNKMKMHHLPEGYIYSLRYTLHWCLGGVVPNEHFGVDEDSTPDIVKAALCQPRPFAVVTNIKNLAERLLNIYPSDSFIFGPYQLSVNDFLFIPADFELSAEDSQEITASGVNVERYDVNQGLAAAIDEKIATLGGYNMQHSRKEPYDSIIDGQFIKGVDAGDFFDEFKRKYSIKDSTLHSNTVWSDIEQVLCFALSILLEDDIDYGYTFTAIQKKLDKHKELLNYIYPILDCLSTENIKMVDKYKELLESSTNWYNLLQLEIMLQVNYRKSMVTILSGNHQFRKEVIERLYSKEESMLTDNFCEEILSRSDVQLLDIDKNPLRYDGYIYIYQEELDIQVQAPPVLHQFNATQQETFAQEQQELYVSQDLNATVTQSP